MKCAGFVLLIASVVTLRPAEPVPANSLIRLQGRVMVRGTANAVPNARIVVAKVGGAVEDYRATLSDSRGWFTISDLAPGSYRVYADAQGYLRSEYGKPPVAPAGTPIVLTEGGTPPDATIWMTPTGVITGRVTDRGRPAPNVYVRALRPRYLDGQRYLNVAEYAITDDRGEYRLFDLPAGSYYVSAIPANRPRLDGDALVTPTIPSNANSNRSEIRTPATIDNITASAFEPGVSPAVYYPGSTDPAAATAIDLAPGATVLAIDLALARSGIYHVRGRITAQGFSGAPRVRVSIFPSESGTALLIPPIEGPLGDFDLPGVPPGKYHITATPLAAPGERSTPFTSTRVPIEVWDRDVDGVTAVLQPGVTVSGRVLIDGAPPPPDRLPFVQLIGLNGQPGTSAQRVTADGTFTLNNVAMGEYRWRLLPLAGGPRNPWVKTATFGADEVSGRIVTIGADAASRKLELDISTRTAVLSAVVMDRQKKPMEGVLVMVVPEPGRRIHSDEWRSGVTDAKGGVQFEGMAPGTYLLFATETIPAEAWQDPAVLKRYENRLGPPLKVEEGARHLRVLTVIS
jgi:hypothetical protein